MKAFVTKVIPKDGIIQEVEADQGFRSHIISVKSTNWIDFYKVQGKQWHLTRESAITRAEYMRVQKIESLKKQITKLENLKFQ